MKITIVYDSIFGNTAELAKAIAIALRPGNEVKLMAVHDAVHLDLTGTDLLIVGSPTRGFRPTPQISEFLSGLREVQKEMRAAVFDTRIDLETIHPAALRWVVEAGGYAADRMAQMVAAYGLVRQSNPIGFLVMGTEGPLKAGETERAQQWAKELTL